MDQVLATVSLSAVGPIWAPSPRETSAYIRPLQSSERSLFWAGPLERVLGPAGG